MKGEPSLSGLINFTTIGKILRNRYKLDDYFDRELEVPFQNFSINKRDPRLVLLFKKVIDNQGIIAGGYTENIVSSKYFALPSLRTDFAYAGYSSDIDIFFHEQKNIDNFIQSLYSIDSLTMGTPVQTQSQMIDYPSEFLVSYLNLSFTTPLSGRVFTIQLNFIIPNKPLLEHIKTFDFYCCQTAIIGYTKNDFKLVAPKIAIDSIKSRTLIFNKNVKFRRKSFKNRLMKYFIRGYKVNEGDDVNFIIEQFVPDDIESLRRVFSEYKEYFIENVSAKPSLKDFELKLQLMGVFDKTYSPL